MLFHAPEFVFGFLPVALVVFFIAARVGSQQASIAWLVLVSLFFYGWGTAAHVLLIAGSIFFNFCAGLVVRRNVSEGKRRSAQTVLTGAITVNLATLGYFKYRDFFVTNFNTLVGTDLPIANLLLPLAISFFTLQQIAYLVDVYRGRAEEARFIHYCLFVTFFPQLIAGPIVHHGEMLPQFRNPAVFRADAGNIAEGLTIFLLGLFKKAVIADSLAHYVSPVFAAADAGTAPSLYAAWGAALAFGFQIYFDFSAYSDMAIGIARMLSIRLPMNFASPYRATSIIEFWRRWHMTLSRFLRDYLYIPLGGNRKGPARRYVNLMLTMLIGGLWHGAAWNFVIWGALHGAYLIVNHGWHKLNNGQSGSGIVTHLCGGGLTFFAVTVAWVFFRAETFAGAVLMLEAMAGRHGALLPAQLVALVPPLGLIAAGAGSVPFLGGGTVLGFVEQCGILLLAAAIVFCFRNVHEMNQRQRLVLVVLTAALTLRQVIWGDGAVQFIYFRF